MTKRAKAPNGQGTVKRRADGRWHGRLSYVDPVTGERERVNVYGRTKREASDKLEAIRDRLKDGDPPKDATVTVAAWLETWISTTLAVSDRKQSTKDNYATLARSHLTPAPFGALQLDKLRPVDVERLILALREHLAPSSVRAVFTVLRQSLDTAVRDGMIRANPAAKVRRPKGERREAAYLSAEQVTTLIESAQGERIEPLLVFLVGTGCRRGEALGLHWADVDLDKSTARIRYTLARGSDGLTLTEPKTERSRRSISLPTHVAARLKEHRREQAEQRLLVGAAWEDRGLVFPNEVGGPWEPRNAARAFSALTEKAELPGVSLHTLRHTTATMLLEAGTPLRVVQEVLGHSSIVVTGDVYSHVAPTVQKDAAEQLSKALGW